MLSQQQGRFKLLFTSTFLLVLGTTAFLLYGGLHNLDKIQTHSETLVNQHQRKLELLNAMYGLARQRSTLLFQMAETPDAFDQDDLFLQFHRNATDFVTLREQLLRYPRTDQESQLLRLQLAASTRNGRLQNALADLIVEGRLEAAREQLAGEAIPGQEKAMSYLAALSQLVQDQARKLLAEGQNNHQAGVRQLLMVGGITLILILSLLGYVFMRLSAGEDLLHGQASATLNSVNEGVITIDRDARINFMNPVAEQLTGYELAEAYGKHIDHVYRIVNKGKHTPLPDPDQEQKNSIDRCDDLALTHAEGQLLPIEDSITSIRNRRGKRKGTAIVCRDVSERRQMNAQLNFQASHDALTGLYNRYAFETKLAESIQNATGPASRSTLLYLDLDQFKIINDTCGHAAGDELLQQLGREFHNVLRSGDTLARLGGDEFGILLHNCPISGGRRIAEALLKTTAEYHFSWHKHTFRVGLSIGITELNESTLDLQQALREADIACFTAKRQGRNRHQEYRDNDKTVVQHSGELQWVHRLTQALEQDRLVLYSQTILNVSGNNKDEWHFEILLRMLDDNNELIMPGAFIPVAERYGLMPRIDRWVIHAAMQALATTNPANGSLLCGINLCGASLNDETLYAFIEEELNESGLPASSFCFEITETDAITNLGAARHLIERLRGKGCSFALDDFGSGHASYTYLKNLPVDYIKIDGGFIVDLLSEPLDQEIVQSLNRVAHVMDIRTIAEFVEDQKTLEMLALIGVDHAQGYGIGQPEPLLSKLKELAAQEQQDNGQTIETVSPTPA